MYNHRAGGWAAFDDLSLKLVGTTTNLAPNPGFESGNLSPVDSTVLSQAVTAYPGTSYTLNATLQGLMSDPAAQWSLKAVFLNAAGSEVGRTEVANQATPVTQTPVTVGGTLTAPAGTASVKAELKVKLSTGRLTVYNPNQELGLFRIPVRAGTASVTKYYYHGGARVAVRSGSTLQYILADHLGSTTLITNTSGG